MKPYYENELVKIYNADCMDIMPDIEHACPFNLTLTDPPYGVSGELNTKTAQSRGHRKNDYASITDSVDFVKRVAVPCIEICIKSCDRVILTPGNRCFTLYPMPDSFGSIYQPASVGLQPWGRADSQPILYYGKSPHGGRELPLYACSHQSTKRAERNAHPCPKPIALWATLMKHGSLEGEHVLDPFLGSGTTAVAAMMLNRKCIGIELEEKYCEIAAKRCEQARTGLTPAEQEEGQMTLFEEETND